MEIEFLWPPFCFKKDKTTLTDAWVGSEKGILHFTFTVVCSTTGPGNLKFITDSLIVGLNQSFLILAKSDVPMMLGGAMPHEMYEFIKSFSCTPLKNTSGFEIKFCRRRLFVSHNRKKDNSCLFEACVQLQLQSGILGSPKSRYPVVHSWLISNHYREGVQSTEIYYPRGNKYFETSEK